MNIVSSTSFTDCRMNLVLSTATSILYPGGRSFCICPNLR